MDERFLTLLRVFIKEKGFVRYQIDSYNDFVTRRIPKILHSIGTIKPEVPDLGELKIKLGEFRIGQPSVKEADGSVRNILPMEARIRNLTYAAPMFVEMTSYLNGIEHQSSFVNFGDLPVMVKSKICPLSSMSKNELIRIGEDPDDPGGYFIINGTERILVLVEEVAQNRIIVEKVKSGNVSEIARIHSEKDGYIQRHLIERRNDGIITISFANITRIPILVIIKALGLESDRDILTAISLDEDVREEFLPNIYEIGISTTEEAWEFLEKYFKLPQKRRRKERVKRLLDKYLLPHLGQDPSNRLEKAMFLAKAIEKLLKLHLGKIEEDDIDHYSNKRVRLAGDLMELLLRAILLGKWGLLTRITYNYQKLTKRGKMPPLQAVVESNVLTNQIISALAIGTWVGGRTGVSQRLERMSYVKTLSHMRNVLSPLTSTQEHFEARELHPTHWGKLCPSETPEGATIGLRKHLATMAEITFGLSDKERKSILACLSKWVKR